MAGGGTVKEKAKLNSQQISVIVLTVLLGGTGLCVLVWMAAAGWQDVTGIVVGAIFVVLTVLQAVFAVFWWRSQKRTQQQYTVQMEEEVKMTNINALECNPQNNSNTTGLLVTDEVKMAYTDGAQKVDVEMVTIG